MSRAVSADQVRNAVNLGDEPMRQMFEAARAALKAQGMEVCGFGLRAACSTCKGRDVPCAFRSSCEVDGVYTDFTGERSIRPLHAFDLDKFFVRAKRYYPRITSYGLKHMFQSDMPRRCSVYSTNGAFIVFMHANGFEGKPAGPGSPNVVYKLKLV